MLTEQIKQKIKSHSLEEYKKNKESCGFIINDSAFPCINISNKPKSFTINPYDYIAASKIGEIKGIYHSHFDKEDFSELDKQSAQIHNLDLIMYHIPSDKFNIYYKERNSKYIGRKFDWETGGCLSVVKDYLYNKTKIKIPEYSVGENLDNNLILDNYKNEGFIKVEDYQENDVLIFNIRGKYHIAVYLGNSLILHQPRNRDSLVDDLGNYQHYLLCILRHKSLF